MNLLKLTALSAIVVLSSGCAMQTWYPSQFDTVQQVYPERADASLYESAPESSRVSASFPAPYSDVVAVAERSATQNQWNVVSVDENSGNILASRAVKDQFRTPNGYLPADRRYHYVIGVQETAAADTRVWVVAKTQGACMQASRGTAAALSFGISEAYIPSSMKNCKKAGSKTMWAAGENSARHELEQLVILIRNNLIALGYE